MRNQLKDFFKALETKFFWSDVISESDYKKLCKQIKQREKPISRIRFAGKGKFRIPRKDSYIKTFRCNGMRVTREVFVEVKR